MLRKRIGRCTVILQKVEHQYWLCLLAVIQFFILVSAFFPGRYSPDTLQQLRQARGKEALSDWQPVIMALIWRAGIYITGTKASLLILELGLMIGAFLLFGLGIIWQKCATPKWAYLVVLLPIFPPVVCISGSLWKDQLMTYLLLFGVSVLFVLPSGKRGWVGAALAMLLFMIATLVRANAIFSVLLLLPLFWNRLEKGSKGLIQKKKNQKRQGQDTGKKYNRQLAVLVVLIFLGGVIGTGTIIKTVARPVPTHQIDQLLLDDIIFSASSEDIQDLPISADFKANLLRNKHNCGDRFVDNTIWTCSFEKPIDMGSGVKIPAIISRYHEEFMKAWLYAVPKNFGNYLWYRADAFTQLLFSPRDFAMRAATENRAHYSYYSEKVYSEVGNKRALSVVSRAVDNFNINYVPLVICPALWAGVGIWLLIFLYRYWKLLPEQIRIFAFYLNSAGMFYLISLFPIVPANDYRYAYFTICTTALSLLLVVGAYVKVKSEGFTEPEVP